MAYGDPPRKLSPAEAEANDRLRPHDHELNTGGFIGLPKTRGDELIVDIDGLFTATQLRLVADALEPPTACQELTGKTPNELIAESMRYEKGKL